MPKKCRSQHLVNGINYLFAQDQESHHVQGLSNIGDLLAQSLAAALGVHLHKLVLGDHLLESAECGLDIIAR